MENSLKYLDFYTEEEAARFFGRDEEIKALCRLAGMYPVVVMSGESGTGKTSLLRAGITPVLKNFRVLYHRVNAESRHQLPEELSRAAKGSGKAATGLASAFVLAAEEPAAADGRILLILDQFEELLVEQEEESSWFPATLLEPVFTNKHLVVLFSLRSDYLPSFMQWLSKTRIHFLAEQFFYLQRPGTDQAIRIFEGIFAGQGTAPGYEKISRITAALAELDTEHNVYPPHIQIVAAWLISQAAGSQTVVSAHEESSEDVESILASYFNRELFRGFNTEKQVLVKQLLDLLVGREGLRRKYTLAELAKRLREDSTELAPLLDQLIGRRVIRRTAEERFELIHDFLSRHFFETFSSSEKKKRKLQDMFYTALTDYREANIFLDERRTRLFLHNRQLLDLDREGRIFLIKSALPLNNIGFNPYLDLGMFDDILEILKTEKDKNARGDILSRIRELIGYSQLPVIKEFYRTEKDPYNRGVLVDIMAALDGAAAIEVITACLKDWKNQPERFLENILYTLRELKDFNLPELLYPVIEGSNVPEIVSAAISALGRINGPEVIDWLLGLVEHNTSLQPRPMDDCLILLDDLIPAAKNTDESDSFGQRYMRLLQYKITEDEAGLYPSLLPVYIRRATPPAGECNTLLSSCQDSSRCDALVSAMADTGKAVYGAVIRKYIAGCGDLPSLSTAIRSLVALEAQDCADYLVELYRKSAPGYIRSEILYALEQQFVPGIHSLLREVLADQNSDQEVLRAALMLLGRYGDAADMEAAGKLTASLEDESLYTACINSIHSFPDPYAPAATRILEQMWEQDMPAESRVNLACRLLNRGSSRSIPFLLEKLANVDEKFKGRAEQVFITLPREAAADIMVALYRHNGAIPEREAFGRLTKELVLHAANRILATTALIVYGLHFASDPETAQWFAGLTETADRPEMRGIAALALAANPLAGAGEIIRELVYQAPWEITRRLALYAYGILKTETDEQKKQYLMDYICSTEDSNLCDHALYIYSGMTHNNDISLLEGLLQGRRLMRVGNRFIKKRIRETVDSIGSLPLAERCLPGYRKLLEPGSFLWMQSLGIHMIWTNY